MNIFSMNIIRPLRIVALAIILVGMLLSRLDAGLKLIPHLSLIPQISPIMVDGDVEHGGELTYRCEVAFLLQNRGSCNETVATACELERIRDGEFRLKVYLRVVDGIPIKPPLASLGIVDLGRGEYAVLGEVEFVVQDLDELPGEISVSYWCDEELGLVYDDIWTGTIKSTIVPNVDEVRRKYQRVE